MTWADIRDEYAQTDIGLRPLAAKHGVSFNTLKGYAKREQWSQLRAEYRLSMGLESVRRTAARTERRKQDRAVDRIPEVREEQAERVSGVFATAEKLLCAIDQMVDEGKLKSADIKCLTGALKDIKEIQMLQETLAPKIQLIIRDEGAGDEQ